MEIRNFLTKYHSLQIVDEVFDWESAIRIAASPLINAGAIEERYSDAMIDVTKKRGPYYVLGDNIAMPHSKPTDGVIETAVALLLLKKPVCFEVEGFDKRYADMIFVFAAQESGKDIQGVISELLAVAENTEVLKKLRSSTKKGEILDLFTGDSF